MQRSLDSGGVQRLVANSKNELYQIGVAAKTGRLRPVPIVAGSFWRAMLSIGHGMQLLPELETSSALMMQLSGDPESRDEQCTAIHMEIQRLRDTTQDSWRAYDAHFLRYLHASLMCNGFPWNPASNNYVVNMMRAMVPFALARLRLWLLAGKQGALQDQDVVNITYTIERAISHNNLVMNILERHPELLELAQYHRALLSL